MKPIKQLAGQTAIYGLGTIVPRLLNYLLLTPFYTRIFELGEYGVITELYAYVAFLMVLLTYGMETAFFRFAEKEKQPGRAYSTTLLSLATTTSLFVVFILIFTQPVANAINYPSNKEYIVLFSFIVGLDALTAIPFALLRQQNKAFRFAGIKIINVLVNIGANVFFLVICPRLIEQNPDSFVRFIYNENIGIGYAFISNLIASVVSLLLLFPEIFRVRLFFDRILFRRMLIYALPLLVVGLAGMVNEVSDKILLKFLISIPPGTVDAASYALEQVGIYGANFKLAVLMTLFIQMFRYAADPFFFAQANKENPQQVYADVMKYFVIFCFFIFLGVTLYIDLFKYFIGPDFRTGLYIVPVVLMANLFLGVFYNLSVWYKLNDLTKYGAFLAIMGAIITIVFNVILVPVFGFLGSAWAHFACYFSMMIVSYFLGRKFYPIKYDLKRILGYFTLTMLLFFAAKIFFIGNIYSRLGLNTVLILIFVMVVYFVEKNKLRAKNVDGEI